MLISTVQAYLFFLLYSILLCEQTMGGGVGIISYGWIDRYISWYFCIEISIIVLISVIS